MISATRLLAPAALVAALALPATASAAPTSKSVANHAAKAQSAFGQIAAFANVGHDSAALAALRKAQREASLAARDARALVRNARSAGARRAAGYSVARVASLYNGQLEGGLGILDEIDGTLRGLLANHLPMALNIREMALNVLAQIVPLVPEPARAALEKILATLSSDAKDEVQATSGLIAGGLPIDVDKILSSVLATASGAMNLGLARLQDVLGMLPEPAKGQIESAIGLISSQLDDVFKILQDSVGVITSTIGPVMNTVISQIGSVMGIIDELLGTTVGGLLGGGQSPVPSFLGGKGLLGGGLLGGGLFGGNLFGGLLGGGTTQS